MTPSEQLWQEAERRANAPEHMKELLALAIDRTTAAFVSSVNYEIGHGAHYQCRVPQPYQTEYEQLLTEYVGKKLQLHKLRKTMYFPYDAYAERDGDFTAVLERCRELRRKIKELHDSIPIAAWGEIPPEKAPTVHDKPLLHAMEDATCGWDHYQKSGEYGCPLEATDWYHGVPYCKWHIGQVRFKVRCERKAVQREANARYNADDISGAMWIPRKTYDIVNPPAEGEPCREQGCYRITAHVHSNGRVEML